MAGLPGRVVIVGASLAGLHAARTLRREGYDGSLTMVGLERQMPYNRPPLSKQYLTSDVEVEGVMLDVADLDADWLLGAPARRLDLSSSRIDIGRGDDVPFDGLVIATGVAPQKLTWDSRSEGLHELRTLDDADELRKSLATATKVAVIGAGFIGAEVAASCRSLGLDVAMIEMAEVPLGRVLGPEMGAVCAELHRRHGTELYLGAAPARLIGSRYIEGVELTDGRIIETDTVVVGVGARPNVGWLEGSGADIGDGVLCDERGQVLSGGRPISGVVAAGDVARWRRPRGGSRRVEHWSNAVEQGEMAALALLGIDRSDAAIKVPYFWSDQYGSKLQFVGETQAGDQVQIVDGSPDEGRFMATYKRQEQVVGALACNMPGKIMRMRMAIASDGSLVG